MKMRDRIKLIVKSFMFRVYLAVTGIVADTGLIRVQKEDNAGLALDVVLIFIIIVFAIIILVKLGYNFNDVKAVIFRFFGV